MRSTSTTPRASPSPVPPRNSNPSTRQVVAACRAGRRRLLHTPAGHAAARTRDVYAVTAALANAGHRHDIDAAISAAAADLGVDVIGVSILANGMNLREIASTGQALDTTVYTLTDYPTTLAVFEGAGTTEVQLSRSRRRPGRAGADGAARSRQPAARAGLDGTRTIGVRRVRAPHPEAVDRAGHRARARAGRAPEPGAQAPRCRDGRAGARSVRLSAPSGVQQRRQREQHDRRPGQVGEHRPENSARCPPLQASTTPRVSAAKTSIGLPVATVASA